MTDSRPQPVSPDTLERLTQASGGRASSAKVKEGVLTLVLDVGGLDAGQRGTVEQAVRDTAMTLPGITDVRIAMTAEKQAGPRIIAVGSGKGGVGKSTLSVNLAVALARLGLKVGMVDADIYGPSLPRLLSSEGTKPRAENSRMIPIENGFGVPMLSMGHLIEPGQAIAWRGPMASNALGQLLDAHWQGTEILVVDLPPGTGDVQLSMLQKHKPAGAVIVSTPQDLALIDAARAISLFGQAGVPIIGMVENMAGYACPHCGEVSDPFGQGGAEAAAAEMGLPFLGRVPLDIQVRRASDAGVPPASGDGAHAEPFAAIAQKVAQWIRGGSTTT
ncbi:Mrp/NBP35 family ATP-binding protein [Sphingobium sufflavum]|uniref:Mrp/NBP35 family ATP-binding protein n=1 Tax=Sphingobium sufflavum TaxID=1129547 RepID=UPI001F1CBCBA|nr:Mrp/NBP35 family ATP-binding protein [Sphingobium sufflavum]MCE7795282.1 Mrp/NBP35 family ATP-binding protein [Sphingobium sufflavum]